MRVISLLAHEYPLSVIQTVHNIVNSTKADLVVVHWSDRSRAERDVLAQGIQSENFPCEVVLNPTSVDTSFLNIVTAHFSNAEHALSIGATTNSQFIMHASNDFYIKQSHDYFSHHRYIFHARELKEKSVQRCAELPVRNALVEKFGRCIYSQPEGTSYPIDVIIEAQKVWVDDSSIFFNTAAEENLIPSLAMAVGLQPTSTPAVFSEVIRSELYCIRYWNFFDRLGLLGSAKNRTLLRRLAEELAILNMSISPALGPIFSRNREQVQQIRASEIDAILQDSYGRKYENVQEGEGTWDVYKESSVFGIKRMPRNPDDPARQRLLRLILQGEANATKLEEL